MCATAAHLIERAARGGREMGIADDGTRAESIGAVDMTAGKRSDATGNDQILIGDRGEVCRCSAQAGSKADCSIKVHDREDLFARISGNGSPLCRWRYLFRSGIFAFIGLTPRGKQRSVASPSAALHDGSTVDDGGPALARVAGGCRADLLAKSRIR